MSTIAITHEQRAARWVLFLAAAVCLTYAGAVGFRVEQTGLSRDIVPQIRVALLTRAASQIEPPQHVKDHFNAVAPKTPAAPPMPKLKTERTAPRKLITAPVKPAPVSPEPTTSTPLPVLDHLAVARKPTPPLPKPAEKKPAKPVQPEQQVAETLPNQPQRSLDSNLGAARQAKATSVIEKPRYRRQTAPVYPRRSLDLGEQGVVLLHVSVLPSGAPDEVKVHESSGFRRLDMAAKAAVRKWEFEPVQARTRQEVTWVRVPVRFVIKSN